MINTYLVTLKNPSANPDEFEERYIYANDLIEAQEQADDIIASHPFDDVELVSIDLVDPGDLYHDEIQT